MKDVSELVLMEYKATDILNEADIKRLLSGDFRSLQELV